MKSFIVKFNRFLPDPFSFLNLLFHFNRMSWKTSPLFLIPGALMACYIFANAVETGNVLIGCYQGKAFQERRSFVSRAEELVHRGTEPGRYVGLNICRASK